MVMHPPVHRARPKASEAPHPAELRGANLDRVFAAALERDGSFTRAELIAETGLSAPTIGSLATDLIRLDLLHDLGPGPSRGGRRPSLMEFNARYGFAAGVDIGPTRTRLAVADLRDRQLANRVVSTPTALAPREMLQQIACDLRKLMHETGVPADRLLAVGAGAPGIVNEHTGVVAVAPNLEGWHDVPMREILQEAFNAPVFVENDVNLAMLGEHWRGAARGHDTCAFILVGTGIGAAVLIDGQLHRGHHFMAGEIGFMCMGPQFVNIDFGEHGCLETIAGLHALAERVPNLVEQDPDGWISTLSEAAGRGEPEARAALLEIARLIGIAVANVTVVVDPSLIVLGGALFMQAPRLVEAVSSVAQSISRAPIPVVLSALDKEAPLWGGLLVALTAARERVRQELRS
ncbi:MAG: ROK family protein [Acidobacteriota bacterium]